jgi:hypothetical protein
MNGFIWLLNDRYRLTDGGIIENGSIEAKGNTAIKPKHYC